MKSLRMRMVDRYVTVELRPRMEHGEVVYKYTLFVPIQEVSPNPRPKATPALLTKLENTFASHFGGYTVPPVAAGFGLRDPNDPTQVPEMNMNASYIVYTAPHRNADPYFRALRKELERTLDEGVILVEKQQVSFV